ncbi:hypothetical protein JXB02_03920 [Candidatus Woesearchaeota archaeon]|nr:hypothetical protein [Candidatus Woesearchaeota archaeon]
MRPLTGRRGDTHRILSIFIDTIIFIIFIVLILTVFSKAYSGCPLIPKDYQSAKFSAEYLRAELLDLIDEKGTYAVYDNVPININPGYAYALFGTAYEPMYPWFLLDDIESVTARPIGFSLVRIQKPKVPACEDKACLCIYEFELDQDNFAASQENIECLTITHDPVTFVTYRGYGTYSDVPQDEIYPEGLPKLLLSGAYRGRERVYGTPVLHGEGTSQTGIRNTWNHRSLYLDKYTKEDGETIVFIALLSDEVMRRSILWTNRALNNPPCERGQPFCITANRGEVILVEHAFGENPGNRYYACPYDAAEQACLIEGPYPLCQDRTAIEDWCQCGDLVWYTGFCREGVWYREDPGLA